jgi:hypothetical protein
VRRRRLIFRSAVLAIALAAAVALTVASLAGPGISIGLFFLAMLAYVIVVAELPRLVAAVRDRSPDAPPPGRWWICELPKDHRLVRTASDDPTWRCTRCGHVQHEPSRKSIAETYGGGEQGWVSRHDDM